MKKVLITGSNGFVGSNLVEDLKGRYQVFGLVRHKSAVSSDELFKWDQLDKVPEVDHIIHLAGKAHDTKNTSAAQEYFDVNLGLTKQIFEHFLRSNARSFIFFSSIKAVSDNPGDEILAEDYPADPLTPYGQSKLAAEKYILSQDLPPDKKIYILRPCMIHGPGNKGNLNLLFKVAKTGIPWPLGRYENNRSMVSIDNITYVINQILDKTVQSGVYHVADDEYVSTNEIISLMAESMGREPRFCMVPSFVVDSIAKLGDYIPFALNSERLQKLTENYIVSNQKIKRALDIDRMPVTAKQGFKKTLDSF